MVNISVIFSMVSKPKEKEQILIHTTINVKNNCNVRSLAIRRHGMKYERSSRNRLNPVSLELSEQRTTSLAKLYAPFPHIFDARKLVCTDFN